MGKGSLSKAPVGIFDSGFGGLTVMKAVMKMLPDEDVVYFGDTARVPYGTKSPDLIVKFSRQNAKVLLGEKVKAIVVACNSSSSYALDILQHEFDVPIIGVIEPGVRKAIEVTRMNRVGVVATQATVNSHAYRDCLKSACRDVCVFEKACPLFVPLVEEGWFSHEVTERVVREYLGPLKKNNIDTLILGCTHYPLLKKILRKEMGKEVALVDSAQEVAKDLKDILKVKKILNTGRRSSRNQYQFLVSDEPKHFQKLAKRFLGQDILEVKKLF